MSIEERFLSSLCDEFKKRLENISPNIQEELVRLICNKCKNPEEFLQLTVSQSEVDISGENSQEVKQS